MEHVHAEGQHRGGPAVIQAKQGDIDLLVQIIDLRDSAHVGRVTRVTLAVGNTLGEY